MTTAIHVLASTAASAGFIHTILGPDHYLPFIMIGKAQHWKLTKILGLTFLCGLGHVLSSVLLGFVGIFLGVGLEKLNIIEASRGNLASWALIIFGLLYAVWGLRKAYKSKKHTHTHLHSCGVVHTHEHSHTSDHSHIHEKKEGKVITPWVLFIIFVLGPCEVLIPFIMYPAAQQSISGMFLVTLSFSITTLLTMLGTVTLGIYGFSFISLKKSAQYVHAIAGAIIFFSGLAIQFFPI